MNQRKALIRLVVWVLVPAWLGGTAWLFWVFGVRDMRPFTDDPRPFVQLQRDEALPAGLAQLLRDVAEPGRPTVIEFRDTGCGCARFNAPHVARIREHYDALGVRFVTVEAGSGQGPGEPRLQSLPRKLSEWLPITASPAALVLDGRAQIAYFGPFSVGAGCLTGSGEFVERALDRVLAGRHAQQFNVLDSGCYCDWPGAAGTPFPERRDRA